MNRFIKTANISYLTQKTRCTTLTITLLAVVISLSGCTQNKAIVSIGEIKCECQKEATLIISKDGGHYCDCGE